ncbi:hypothetical protein [Nocardioides jejuensis]|uniref:Uncharacterized protein n=1 Tax=Nocardioides jejuensis TaxID=2502782 RepID=A0A4R1C1T7_9ACTN|nr:hypothetical protein [Nocardioides jejuensis]TCJ23696.1 hypothetical protein EPD65_10530 [Nocardioides jejuensis]
MATPRAPRKYVTAAVLGIAIAIAGYWVGLRSPWSVHHPYRVEGTAQLVPADVPFAYFKQKGQEHIAFRPDTIPWMAGDKTDSNSIPPCIRKAGQLARVRVTLIEVARPFGSGSYRTIESLVCLP